MVVPFFKKTVLQAFYADNFVLPLPVGHRFPMAKYSLLRDRVAKELAGVVMAEAPAATDGELALVHTPAYIDAISHGTLPAASQREIGFPWSLAMAERARRSFRLEAFQVWIEHRVGPPLVVGMGKSEGSFTEPTQIAQGRDIGYPLCSLQRWAPT